MWLHLLITYITDLTQRDIVTRYSTGKVMFSPTVIFQGCANADTFVALSAFVRRTLVAYNTHHAVGYSDPSGVGNKTRMQMYRYILTI